MELRFIGLKYGAEGEILYVNVSQISSMRSHQAQDREYTYLKMQGGDSFDIPMKTKKVFKLIEKALR